MEKVYVPSTSLTVKYNIQAFVVDKLIKLHFVKNYLM